MKLALTLLAAGTLFTAGAENLFPSGDAEGTAWRKTALSPENAKTGKNSFEISEKSTWVYSPETVEIKPDKTYQLAVTAKSKNPQNLSNSFIGLTLLDEAKAPILRNSVNPIAGSETVLLADAKPGDTVIRVADAAKWKKSMVLALNAKSDMSDLPNRNLLTVKDAAKNGDGWDLTLAAPLKVAVTKDAAVRFHDSAGGHCYSILLGKLPADWKEYRATISGQAKDGAPYGKFWPGTKYARFIIVANYGQDDAGAYFDDVVFEEQQ